MQIDHPDELDEIYDAITYAKSNCVNRMLYEYLGEEMFQNGLRIYLARHAFGNASTVDLWNALTESRSQDIAHMNSGWTKQMGFPLITVSKFCVLALHQTRFIMNGSDDDSRSQWRVPITTVIGPSSRLGEKCILRRSRERLQFLSKKMNTSRYSTLNTGGFYRVAYDGPLLDCLVKNFDTLSALDQFGFASDCFALLVAGRYSATQFLSVLATAATTETESAVWSALDDGLDALACMLAHTDVGLKKRLDAFVVTTLAPMLDRIGWEAAAGDDSLRGQLRSQIINRLARAGHQDTIQVKRELNKGNAMQC